jgi:hypothetical protein
VQRHRSSHQEETGTQAEEALKHARSEWFFLLFFMELPLEDLHLDLGFGTLGAFYVEFALGTVPLILYLFFWGRKHESRKENTYVHFLRISFGYLWILDALLQMQPGMNEHFTSFVIGPNLSSALIFRSN